MSYFNVTKQQSTKIIREDQSGSSDLVVFCVWICCIRRICDDREDSFRMDDETWRTSRINVL